MLRIMNALGFEQTWHVGEPFPMYAYCVQDVTSVRADGAEYDFACTHMRSLPNLNHANQAVWYGDHARFIVGNLATCVKYSDDLCDALEHGRDNLDVWDEEEEIPVTPALAAAMKNIEALRPILGDKAIERLISLRTFTLRQFLGRTQTAGDITGLAMGLSVHESAICDARKLAEILVSEPTRVPEVGRGALVPDKDKMEEWRKEFDALYERMQTKQHRDGIRRAFASTPRELGKAAVAEALAQIKNPKDLRAGDVIEELDGSRELGVVTGRVTSDGYPILQVGGREGEEYVLASYADYRDFRWKLISRAKDGNK